MDLPLDIDGLGVQVGHLSRDRLRTALSEAGVLLNAHAETLLAHAAFDEPRAETVRLTQRTVAELGFPEGGVQSRVFLAAAEQGFALCPVVTGPYLRLAFMDQRNAADAMLSAGRAPADALHIASAPLDEDVEYPKGFYLRVVDGQPWLRGFRCDDEYVWPPDQLLALRMPGAH